MTNREFYETIANAEVTEDLKSFATEAIKKLDAKNEARKSKPSKTAIANMPIKNSIYQYITEHSGAIASEIAEALNITPQKVSALCRQLEVDDRLIISTEKKGAKKGKVKGFSIATVEE